MFAPLFQADQCLSRRHYARPSRSSLGFARLLRQATTVRYSSSRCWPVTFRARVFWVWFSRDPRVSHSHPIPAPSRAACQHLPVLQGPVAPKSLRSPCVLGSILGARRASVAACPIVHNSTQSLRAPAQMAASRRCRYARIFCSFCLFSFVVSGARRAIVATVAQFARHQFFACKH